MQTGKEEGSRKNLDERPGLSRRQSVRFVGPNALPIMTRSITRREAPGYGNSEESHKQSFPTIPVDPPPYSTESSITALPEDFNEDFVASEPSSYRKLKKAKSMFSPGKISSTSFAAQPSNRKRRLERKSMRSLGGTSEAKGVSGPRLQRSYSFLRGVTDRISTGSREYATQDAAIQLARDTFLQQVEQQRLKAQPSFFGMGRRQRTQKAFRRTVRTSSTNSYGTAISSPLPSTEPSAPKRLGSKARTFSQNWKEKIKRAFRRSLIDGDAIPAQHLDASQPHYGNHSLNTQGSGFVHGSPGVSESDTELLHRVSSRKSSLRNEADYGGKVSYPGSVRGFDSDDEDTHDKSRVTSWTNSTAANTINMPLLMERKRLSMIREDGSPIRSSSTIRQNKDMCDNLENPSQPSSNPGAGRLETQRIFSALRKQIDKNNRKAELDAFEANVDNDSSLEKEYQSVSVHRRNSRTGSSSQGSETAQKFDSQGRDLNTSSPVTSRNPTDVNHCSHRVETQDHSDIQKQNETEFSDDLTPQQVAVMNEGGLSLSKRPLRETRSAFFPPSMHIGRSNVSPFRRAMHANSKDQDLEIRPDSAHRRATIKGQAFSGSVTGSESVYSHSSDGHRWKPTASSTSLAESEGGREGGNTVIVTNRALARELSARSFLSPKNSPKYEGENFWASQPAPIAIDRGRRPQESNEFLVKDRSHKKESAQLDGNDVSIGSLQSSKFVAKQPLGLLHGNAVGQPRSVLEGKASLGKSALAQSTNDQQNENSPIRSLSDTSQMRSFAKDKESSASHWNDRSGILNQKTSYASLVSQDSSQRTSVTKDPQHSSERAERLRRLKSNSLATLHQTPPQNENRPARNLSTSPERISQGLPEAGMNTKLVNSFLKDRRREMRISEESSTDPAFL